MTPALNYLKTAILPIWDVVDRAVPHVGEGVSIGIASSACVAPTDDHRIVGRGGQFPFPLANQGNHGTRQ